jgi:hypothetical protein
MPNNTEIESRNQLGWTRAESAKVAAKVKKDIEAKREPASINDILEMAGLKVPADGMAKVGAGPTATRILNNIKSNMKHHNLKLRGGFRSGATKEKRGEYEMLRGDELIRDEGFHKMSRMQNEILGLCGWAAEMAQADQSQLSTETRKMLGVIDRLATTAAAGQIEAMDSSVKMLRKTHPDFESLTFLEDRLDDFSEDAFDEE